MHASGVSPLTSAPYALRQDLLDLANLSSMLPISTSHLHLCWYRVIPACTEPLSSHHVLILLMREFCFMGLHVAKAVFTAKRLTSMPVGLQGAYGLQMAPRSQFLLRVSLPFC